MDNPFEAIAKHWIKKIRLALDHKKEFQKDADQGMRFFNGPYDFLYDLKRANLTGDFVYAGSSELPRPAICMTHNKVAEAVQIFGPVLYHRNPTRTITPRQQFMPPLELMGDPNDPNVQAQYEMMAAQVRYATSIDAARADLMLRYQNYTPVATDLKTNCRRAIDETLIKGMGLLWTEVYHPPGGQFKMIGSFQDSVDNFVMDPDVELREDCKWMARYCLKPVWQVEREYNLPPGTLDKKGHAETRDNQAGQDVKPPSMKDKQDGTTNDLIGYWKIWSKMGLGGYLSGIAEEIRDIDRFGDFTYLVVCDKLNYPLNLHPSIIMDEQAVQQAIQWETPFWADDSWPVTPIIFHDVPRSIWPMSHFKPAMGELKLLNWAYSFIASKIAKTSRDFLVVAKHAGEELKRAILSGSDLELIELEKSHGTINEVVQFLQHPEFNADIWKVIAAISEVFDKRTGLTELMYGSTAQQMRSAEEAAVKADQLRVRPDDMANKVEDAMTDVARREALAARWNLEPQDVQPVLGDMGAHWWSQIVTPTDPTTILHQLEYRIEAGSARKPNKDKQIGDANAAVQTVFTPLWQYSMQSGDVRPANAVVEMWAKANDIEPEKMMIQPPPPPDPNQPDPAMQQLQMDAAESDQEMQQKDAAFKQEIKQKQERHKVEMEILRQKKAMQKKEKPNAA